MGACCGARIEICAVKTDKGDSFGLKIPHQRGILVLKADQKPAAPGLHEIAQLADQPLGRVGHRHLRMSNLEVDRGRQPGEP